MKKLSLVLIALLATSCVAAREAGTAPSVPASAASATPAPTATSRPTVSARLIPGIGGRAQVSPDGKWIALTPPQPGGKGGPPWVPTIELHDIDGKLVKSVDVPTPNWAWMPDSTGLFVALDVPQRPATLGVLDIAGVAPKTTGLMMAGQTLSRDGRWIVAARAEGCCMFVTYPEIRIAPRGGGDAKTLVTVTSDPKSLHFLGIDSADRAVYRVGNQVLRIAVSGGTPQVLGTLSDFTTTMAGNTSPDGTVILVRGYDPLRWYLIANDRVSPWAEGAGTIVEDMQGQRLLFGTAGFWTGAHTLLVRGPSGAVSEFDGLAARSTTTNASLRLDDIVLAYGVGRLLVGRASRAVMVDLATGNESDIGVDLGPESDGARAWRATALPGGGFILSTLTSTYRID